MFTLASETVAVKGSTGNTYTVTLGDAPRCSCPDFSFRGACKDGGLSGHRCKHIYQAQAENSVPIRSVAACEPATPAEPTPLAPVKAAPVDAVILQAIDAYRTGGLVALASLRATWTVRTWNSVGRRLVTLGCPRLDGKLDRAKRLYDFVRACVDGTAVSFPGSTPARIVDGDGVPNTLPETVAAAIRSELPGDEWADVRRIVAENAEQRVSPTRIWFDAPLYRQIKDQLIVVREVMHEAGMFEMTRLVPLPMPISGGSPDDDHSLDARDMVDTRTPIGDDPLPTDPPHGANAMDRPTCRWCHRPGPIDARWELCPSCLETLPKPDVDPPTPRRRAARFDFASMAVPPPICGGAPEDEDPILSEPPDKEAWEAWERSSSESLAAHCINLGADPGAVGAWHDGRRREYIECRRAGTLPDWCSPKVCDGERGESAELLAACIKAEKFIDAIMSFYGQGLEVANWHLNGNLEPLDTFIDDNSDGTELTDLRNAIAKATGEVIS